MQTSINQYVVETVEKNVKANAEITQSNIDNTRKYAAEITENAKSTVVKMVESTNDELKETKLKVESNGSAIETMQKNVDSIDGSQLSGNKVYYLQTSVIGEPSKDSAEWSTIRPASILGQHMWMMAVDVLKNGTEIKHTPVDLTGQPGEAGRGIIGTPKTTYQGSTSGTNVPNGEWSENPPLLNDGMYLWIKRTTSYSDGTSSDEYAVTKNGNTGSAGVGIKDDPIREYYLSSSKTELNGGNWSESKPQASTDKFIWTRYKITYTDLHIGYTKPIYDDALDKVYEISATNKSSIEQLNGSITLLVNRTSENKTNAEALKTELQTLQQQTADAFSRTIQRSEYDKTVNAISEKLDEHGLHIGSDKEDTVTTVDTNGVNVKKSDGTLLAKFDKVDSMLAYLRVVEYLCAGAHRFEANTTEAEITEFVGGSIKIAEIKATIINWIGDIKTYGNA